MSPECVQDKCGNVRDVTASMTDYWERYERLKGERLHACDIRQEKRCWRTADVNALVRENFENELSDGEKKQLRLGHEESRPGHCVKTEELKRRRQE